MEGDKNKSGDPVKKSLNNAGYISREGITNEEIEDFEKKEGRNEKENGPITTHEVSTSNMDPSLDNKGTFSVQESSLTMDEKLKYDKEAEDIKGGGDIGKGRGSGADRA